MLLKKQCKKALQSWLSSKKNSAKFIEMMPPNYGFIFQKSQIEWLRKHNKATHFHAYMGRYKDEAIMMLFPLDQDNRELDLKQYAYAKLQPLAGNLTLVERETKVSTFKSVLSPDLEIISRTHEEEIPLFSHDISSQETLLREITDWRKYSSDWFYQQLKESEGESIFNVFDIPLEDLGSGDEAVFGLFGFKKSEVFAEDLPTIIFLQNQSGLLENIHLERIDSNAYNWSQPCPPFCAPNKGFLLLTENG